MICKPLSILFQVVAWFFVAYMLALALEEGAKEILGA